jgi:YD repeat-containing protein
MNRGWQGHQTYHKPRQIPGGPEEAKGPGEVDFTVLPGLYNNLFIGMPLVTRQEFRVPTRGWPLEFTLVYQHANPSNHAGGAWLHSYDRWVEASSSSTLAYVWGGWGLQTKFLQNVDGTFTSEAGKHETLEELENAQQEVVGYRVTQKDGTIWEYKVWDDVYNRWCLSRLADRYGNSTRLVYDGDTGRVTEVIAPDGGATPRSIQLAYVRCPSNTNDTYQVATVKDPAGQVYQYRYEKSWTVDYGLENRYNLIAATRFLETENGKTPITTAYSYRQAAPVQPASYWLQAIIDPLGNQTRLTHWLAEKIPTGSTEGARPLKEIHDALGGVVRYDYPDLWGGMNPMEWALASDAEGRQTFWLFSGGAVQARIDPDRYVQVFDLDADKNLIRMVDSNGSEVRLSWDANGNTTAVTQVLSGGDTISYTDGDPTSSDESTEIVATVRCTYDPTYNQIASEVDALGRVTTYVYDPQGNLIKRTDPLNQSVTYTYNVYGQQIGTVDARGNTWTFEYDVYGNRTKVTDPENNEAVTEYNVMGLKTKDKDALNRETTYTYDSLHRLIKTTFPDNHYETYEYDSLHRLTEKTDAEGQVTTYTYTALSQLASVTDNDNHTTTYEYDQFGNKIKMTDDKDRETTYEYDDLHRLVQVTYPDSKTETFTYDGAGNLVSKTGRDGETTTMTYDAFKRLLEVVGPGE